MLAEERYNEILRLVNEKKTVTVQELTEVLDTSESTIRRDLTTLHKKGSLVKVHDGATALSVEGMTRDASLTVRRDMNIEEKVAIAKYAAALIEKDDFVYLDAGSSVDLMIDYIAEQEAIYVTNAIGHAQKLLQKGCRVFLLGGELKEVTEAIVGAQAIDSLKRYNFTKGFFGANGVHRERGLTTPDITEALVKEKAMEQCANRYVLADSTKINQISSVTFAGFEEGMILTTRLRDASYKACKNILEVG
ncbi:DeoR/GlpR family DNA-binding transcription regulator [[Clostridium] scindens]|uniref:DeoR/GlpR family DNA-binding transcription regulator n=1 Tax=Clostridium scindens (strain JCM 10418 / VPI 12708) TaxID=29347 RepID=UPI00298BE8D5|nr:DeoR/GlpR family DNA-binding transcription regulator [[Clostridium] scindens]WPB18158.1 Lactose phosphotransferase system repressor [[Clostridium] scindens]